MASSITLGRHLLAGASLLAFVAATNTGVIAASNEELEAQLQLMQKQIQLLQRQIEENKASAARAANSAARSEAAAESAAEAASAAKSSGEKKDDLDLKVKWKGAPELSSKDGKFKMKVRGRLQTDYSAIDQDQSITGQPDVSAAELRRARLGVEGVLWEDIAYKFEVDFANDETAIKDAYFEYTCWGEDFHLRFGNFKTFNSLEHMTSSRFITFMERAAFVEAFELDRQIGAGAIYAQDHFTLSAGIFGPHPFDEEEWLKDVKSGAARVTVAPINNEETTLHFGASWRQRHGAEDFRDDPVPANDQFFRYRARGADLHLADRFVATPEIFDADTFWGAEGAFIWGPWSIQGEYAQLLPAIAPGFLGVDPTYYGWYVEGSWYLTGERRTYDEGEIGRPKVKNPVNAGGHGAWQLAAKYDVINLNDNAAAIPECTMCGEQSTWLVGLNWWLNDHTRLTFDYNQSKIEGGFLNGANVNDGATIKGFGTRAQVDW